MHELLKSLPDRDVRLLKDMASEAGTTPEAMASGMIGAYLHLVRDARVRPTPVIRAVRCICNVFAAPAQPSRAGCAMFPRPPARGKAYWCGRPRTRGAAAFGKGWREMASAIDALRAEVMAQPEVDRLEYALELVSFYLEPVPAFFDGCADLRLNLPLADLRVLYALDRQRGKFLSPNALLSARCLDRPHDEWAEPEKVTAAVSKIRKRLTALGLPVIVRAWQGVGYCLTAPGTFRFEDGATAQGGVS